MLALLLPDETFIFTTNATKLSRFITKSISHKSDENSSVGIYLQCHKCFIIIFTGIM